MTPISTILPRWRHIRAACSIGSLLSVEAAIRTASMPSSDGKLLGEPQHVLTRAKIDDVRAESPRQIRLRRIGIDGQHLAAVGAQQLYGDEADETQPDDANAFADGGFREP